MLGIADFASEGDRVFGRWETRHAMLHESREIVDYIAGELAQPIELGLVVVALDAEAAREVAENVDVVAAFIHRLDRLTHEDRVVAGASPRGMYVVSFPKGGGREHDVGITRGRR